MPYVQTNIARYKISWFHGNFRLFSNFSQPTEKKDAVKMTQISIYYKSSKSFLLFLTQAQNICFFLLDRNRQKSIVVSWGKLWELYIGLILLASLFIPAWGISIYEIQYTNFPGSDNTYPSTYSGRPYPPKVSLLQRTTKTAASSFLKPLPVPIAAFWCSTVEKMSNRR